MLGWACPLPGDEFLTGSRKGAFLDSVALRLAAKDASSSSLETSSGFFFLGCPLSIFFSLWM
jgi:hypothetical protein